MRNDILNNKEFILECINKNLSKSRICFFLKCKPDTLNSYLKKMDIIYNGNMGGKGIKIGNKTKAIQYLKYGTIINPLILKLKLIDEGYKKHECEKCRNSEWLGEKIPLELHHIDGDRFNNILENLQILCPNCHTLTPNFSGKNKNRNKLNILDININEYIREKKDVTVEEVKKERKNKRKKLNCIECDKCFEVRYNKKYDGNKFCSKVCMNINKSKHIPSKEHLMEDIKKLKSYVQIGKKYKVSDNTIRKWFKKYNMLS